MQNGKIHPSLFGTTHAYSACTILFRESPPLPYSTSYFVFANMSYLSSVTSPLTQKSLNTLYKLCCKEKNSGISHFYVKGHFQILRQL